MHGYIDTYVCVSVSSLAPLCNLNLSGLFLPLLVKLSEDQFNHVPSSNVCS